MHTTQSIIIEDMRLDRADLSKLKTEIAKQFTTRIAASEHITNYISTRAGIDIEEISDDIELSNFLQTQINKVLKNVCMD